MIRVDAPADTAFGDQAGGGFEILFFDTEAAVDALELEQLHYFAGREAAIGKSQ